MAWQQLPSSLGCLLFLNIFYFIRHHRWLCSKSCCNPTITVLWWCCHCLACWHCCRWLIVVFKKSWDTITRLDSLRQGCHHCAMMVTPLLSHLHLLAGTIAAGWLLSFNIITRSAAGGAAILHYCTIDAIATASLAWLIGTSYSWLIVVFIFLVLWKPSLAALARAAAMPLTICSFAVALAACSAATFLPITLPQHHDNVTGISGWMCAAWCHGCDTMVLWLLLGVTVISDTCCLLLLLLYLPLSPLPLPSPF